MPGSGRNALKVNSTTAHVPQPNTDNDELAADYIRAATIGRAGSYNTKNLWFVRTHCTFETRETMTNNACFEKLAVIEPSAECARNYHCPRRSNTIRFKLDKFIDWNGFALPERHGFWRSRRTPDGFYSHANANECQRFRTVDG